MSSHDTTIGILTYRRLDMLVGCLDSVYRCTDGLDRCKVIVGNTSTDENFINAAQEACAKYPSVQYVAFRKNIGFARANNWMARQADPVKVVLLNDDVKVFGGWKWAVDRTLEDPKMGLMSLSLANGPEAWEHQESRNPRVDIGGLQLARYVCTYPTGAALMLRREVFDRSGGFDENFFQALEEVDLGIRIAQTGLVNANVGVSGEGYKFIAHYGSASGGSAPIAGDIPVELVPVKNANAEYFARKHGFSFPFPDGVEARLTAHMRSS